MSDTVTANEDFNIAKHFYAEFYQIANNDGDALTNIYISYANRNAPVLGTVYLFHGYGGSPVEPCMKIPMTQALGHGFDVVAMEGASLSATYGGQKVLSKMNLARQKHAISRGLRFCNRLPRLCTTYKLAWSHSLSCRALSDMVVDSVFVRKYFNEIVLNNPYFITPTKVEVMRQKYMRRDPSGKLWDQFVQRAGRFSRMIEDRTYVIPTNMYNLLVPLPSTWQYAPENLEELAARMSDFAKELKITFVLGTADDMAEYNKNVRFYNGLTIPNKELICIEGANHPFENSIEQYDNATRQIFDHICARRMKEK